MDLLNKFARKVSSSGSGSKLAALNAAAAPGGGANNAGPKSNNNRQSDASLDRYFMSENTASRTDWQAGNGRVWPEPPDFDCPVCELLFDEEYSAYSARKRVQRTVIK